MCIVLVLVHLLHVTCSFVTCSGDRPSGIYTCFYRDMTYFVDPNMDPDLNYDLPDISCDCYDQNIFLNTFNVNTNAKLLQIMRQIGV